MSKPKHTEAVKEQELSLQPASYFLKQFAGQWSLSRNIQQSNGETLVFTGNAEFCWQQSELIYNESGLVTTPDGRSFQAQRSYIWKPGKPDVIDVYFDDGRFFHSFSKQDPRAEHLCAEDHYKVSYNFTHWPQWEALWVVSGPRKDYTMTSRYVPE